MLDRTGKFVRGRVAGDVAPGTFELDGAHDVACSTTDGGQASDGDQSTDDGPDGDGVAAAGTASSAEGPVTECTFTFTGNVNDLVSRLGDHDVIDLDVEEAPLEEVFMRFYGETDA